LEAIAAQALIAAHDNPFNKAVLAQMLIIFIGG